MKILLSDTVVSLYQISGFFTEFTIAIVRDINIIMWVQKTAMAVLVRLAIYCFTHLQGIHFDLVVIIIVLVNFGVQSHMLHNYVLAYSIINFLDKKLWIFKICIIKWSTRLLWECYHWSKLQGGWRN